MKLSFAKAMLRCLEDKYLTRFQHSAAAMTTHAPALILLPEGLTARQLWIDNNLHQFERDREATPILPPASWGRFRSMPVIEEAASTSQASLAVLQEPQRPPSRRSARCDPPALAPATRRPSLRVVTSNLRDQGPYDLTPIAGSSSRGSIAGGLGRGSGLSSSSRGSIAKGLG